MFRFFQEKISEVVGQYLPDLNALGPEDVSDDELAVVEAAPAENIRARELLTSDLNPGFGQAVYITGADALLGEWQQAERLQYDEETQHWQYLLPLGVKQDEYKFLTGSFELGEKASTAQLSFEPGNNRQLENGCKPFIETTDAPNYQTIKCR